MVKFSKVFGIKKATCKKYLHFYILIMNYSRKVIKKTTPFTTTAKTSRNKFN
jgi:hypothetical protein